MDADIKKVRLQSSDGKVVEVNTEVIKLSNLIKRKMADQPESDTIQLPNVNAAILNKVVQWCEYHKSDLTPLDENTEKRTEEEVRSWDAEFMKANQGDLYDLSLAANHMNIEGLLDLTTPIRQLPSELLVRIIDKLPRTQWPSLELIDHKFRDAVLLAWGSVREVDIERDFIYSESTAIKGENDYGSFLVTRRLCRQRARKTEAILQKLSERSPYITSLSGVSLIINDTYLNTTAVQYLSRFDHLETIRFAQKSFFDGIDNDIYFLFSCGIPLINFIEFMESTRSRASLKEIYIDQCDIPNDPIMAVSFDQRLRTAFANDLNDPIRQLLQLESFTMRLIGRNYPLTFLDSIDASRLTKLSMEELRVEPAVLTILINGGSQLRHLDFAFLKSCHFYDDTRVCQGERRQPNKELLAALESHPNLTSLGFNSIWYNSFPLGSESCACNRFVAEFKHMLRTIGPRLINLVFNPNFFPPDVRMAEIRDIIQNHMPQLKSITLGECCAKDPEEFRGIADGKKLDEIEITAFSNGNNYETILNEVMSTVLNKSPRLKRFIGVNYFPDKRVATDLCKLSDLMHLRIRADRLTEENFVTFSHQVFADKLEILHFGWIREGAEFGLMELIEKATQLRELTVDRNVSDKLLECLGNSCPNLEKFYASSADGITFGGLQTLVDRCPRLRWLRVDKTARTLASSLKNLRLGRYRKLELTIL